MRCGLPLVSDSILPMKREMEWKRLGQRFKCPIAAITACKIRENMSGIIEI
jgi:hypothetical protein